MSAKYQKPKVFKDYNMLDVDISGIVAPLTRSHVLVNTEQEILQHHRETRDVFVNIGDDHTTTEYDVVIRTETVVYYDRIPRNRENLIWDEELKRKSILCLTTEDGRIDETTDIFIEGEYHDVLGRQTGPYNERVKDSEGRCLKLDQLTLVQATSPNKKTGYVYKLFKKVWLPLSLSELRVVETRLLEGIGPIFPMSALKQKNRRSVIDELRLKMKQKGGLIVFQDGRSQTNRLCDPRKGICGGLIPGFDVRISDCTTDDINEPNLGFKYGTKTFPAEPGNKMGDEVVIKSLEDRKKLIAKIQNHRWNWVFLKEVEDKQKVAVVFDNNGDLDNDILWNLQKMTSFRVEYDIENDRVEDYVDVGESRAVVDQYQVSVKRRDVESLYSYDLLGQQRLRRMHKSEARIMGVYDNTILNESDDRPWLRICLDMGQIDPFRLEIARKVVQDKVMRQVEVKEEFKKGRIPTEEDEIGDVVSVTALSPSLRRLSLHRTLLYDLDIICLDDRHWSYMTVYRKRGNSYIPKVMLDAYEKEDKRLALTDTCKRRKKLLEDRMISLGKVHPGFFGEREGLFTPDKTLPDRMKELEMQHRELRQQMLE